MVSNALNKDQFWRIRKIFACLSFCCDLNILYLQSCDMILIIALFKTRTCDARRQKSMWHKPLKFTHPSTASAYLNTDLKQQQHVKGPRSDRLLTEGGNACYRVPDYMTLQPVSQVQNFLGQAKQYGFWYTWGIHVFASFLSF